MAIADLSFWQFYYRFFHGPITSEQIIEFLRPQAPVSKLRSKSRKIAVGRLPPYAPEPNTAKAICAYLAKLRPSICV